jgi:hypothetical protein
MTLAASGIFPAEHFALRVAPEKWVNFGLFPASFD